MTEYLSLSTEDTERFAQTFANRLSPGDTVALYGGLGMGKTAFVRGLAKGLNVTSEVSSPTFALVHEYDGKVPVYHFDMYRINSLDDLYSTGFFDYLDGNGIVVVEWSENVSEYLPKTAISINISLGNNESERRITIQDENIIG